MFIVLYIIECDIFAIVEIVIDNGVEYIFLMYLQNEWYEKRMIQNE
jgi:hypothetical protein